jgi:cystathionine beta-lyase/cystathionine gamma-synthase
MIAHGKHASATLCAHAGVPRSGIDAPAPRPHVAPIAQTSVFDFSSIEASLPALAGDGHVYRRNGSPNGDELGAAVAALEGAEAGLATGSGMGAIAASLLSACGAGDRLVVQRDVYGGTRALCDGDLARFGVQVVYVDAHDEAAFAAAVDGARAALIETLSNPLLRVADVAALAARCRRAGALLVVDNTFATPLRDRPLDAGADLVVHSATKFLGGHHDLCAGAVAGAAELVAGARALAVRLGLGPAPLDAWLAVRGIRTLDVRMRRAWQTAAELADRLGGDRRVHRTHAAERCALVSFDVGDRAAAERVVRALELCTLSPSLGGVTTTVSHSATSSHRALSAAERAAAGIGEGLLRLSVGLEDPADVWADLDRALG